MAFFGRCLELQPGFAQIGTPEPRNGTRSPFAFQNDSEGCGETLGFGLRSNHFIITVLGRSITAEQLAQVSSIISAHQMNIDRIDRLSRQLTPEAEPANACVELAVSGEPSREVAMRAEFLAAAQRGYPSILHSSGKASSSAIAGFLYFRHGFDAHSGRSD